MKLSQIKVVTFGSAVQDTRFPAHDAQLTTLYKPYKRQIMAFDYGAKYAINEVNISTGGGGCNTAIDFSKLGHTTYVMGIVGNDSAGAAVIDSLRNHHVNTSFMQQVAKGNTAFSTIISLPTKSSKEHVIFHHRGVANKFTLNLKAFEKIKPDIVYLCSLRSDKWESIMAKIGRYRKKRQKSGKPVLVGWNPGSHQLADKKTMAKLLPQIDICIVNRREATQLVSKSVKVLRKIAIKKLLRQLHAKGSRVVVITDGKDGAYAYDGETEYYTQKYKKVKTIDTTGVGDAFGSSFTSAYNMTEGDIMKSLRIAAINASYVSSVRGAQQGALSMKQILSKLQGWKGGNTFPKA